MPANYAQYMQPSYLRTRPLARTDRNSGIIPLSNPMYTPPLQQRPIPTVSPLQQGRARGPYVPLMTPKPVPSQVSSLPDVQLSEPVFYTPENSPTNIHTAQYSEVNEDTAKKTKQDLDFYVKLPKELFPTARMLDLDPNPLIDEFCKMENVHENTAWVLDLEFGIPRAPVTRAIAMYDVKYNSVQCKNAPSAIHPGFEKCSPEFKRALRFYYDCVLSTWYRGYILLNSDRSVENFQSWLSLPMQILGMCWP